MFSKSGLVATAPDSEPELRAERLVIREPLRKHEPARLLERGNSGGERRVRVEPARQRELPAPLRVEPVGRALDPEVRDGGVRMPDGGRVGLEATQREGH